MSKIGKRARRNKNRQRKKWARLRWENNGQETHLGFGVGMLSTPHEQHAHMLTIRYFFPISACKCACGEVAVGRNGSFSNGNSLVSEKNVSRKYKTKLTLEKKVATNEIMMSKRERSKKCSYLYIETNINKEEISSIEWFYPKSV